MSISKWYRRHENIFNDIVIAVFSLIALLIALVLFSKGKIDIYALFSMLLPLIIALILLRIHLIKRKHQTLLISCTSRYLLSSDDSKLDDLLGILISGQWKNLKLDPIDEFFSCLNKLLMRSGYEMRRRIAEALPALFEIDLEAGEELTKILRIDWDDEWTSDNRRRAIEALPYIIKKDKDFVKENLKLIEGDEIYSVIAILEVLHLCIDDITIPEHDAIIKNLIDQMVFNNFDKTEIDAIKTLWNILNLLETDIKTALDKFKEFKDDQNIFIQIGLARNLSFFIKQYPEDTLELLATFSDEGRHKNVRRPVAKEKNVSCLIGLLKNRKHSTKSQKVIWNLINDKDEIIRRTAFDLIDRVLEIDNHFGNEILNHVIQEAIDPTLVRRAQTLKERMK